MPGTEVSSGDENIGGSVSISSGTVNVGNFPAVQPVDDNGGSLTVDDGGGSLTVDGAFFQAVQPVSVAALPLPAGAATAANQATEIASLASIDLGIPAALGQTVMASSMPVVIASNQSPVPISGTVTVTDGAGPLTVDGTVAVSNFPAVQPISAAALPLPAGASTAANQATEIASLASIDAGIPAALGQTVMAASMPVTIASNQSALPITAAALPLPAGAATAANQATEITSLASIDAGIPAALGPALAAASMPVTLATDTLPLPGFSYVVMNDLGAANTTFMRRIRTDIAGAVTVANFTLAGGAYVPVGPVEPASSARNAASIIVTRISGAAGSRVTSALARRVTIWYQSAAPVATRPTINAVALMAQMTVATQGGPNTLVIGSLDSPGVLPAMTIATHLAADEMSIIEEL